MVEQNDRPKKKFSNNSQTIKDLMLRAQEREQETAMLREYVEELKGGINAN